MILPDIKTPLIVAAVAGSLAFVGGFKVAAWRADAEKLEVVKATQKALAALTNDRDKLADSLAAANDQHSAALRKAQNETNSIRDRLRAGTVGLRIAATCPDHPAPESSPGSRVDSGGAAELNEPARQAYFALRDGIDRAAAQLAGCQAELRLRSEIP